MVSNGSSSILTVSKHNFVQMFVGLTLVVGYYQMNH